MNGCRKKAASKEVPGSLTLRSHDCEQEAALCYTQQVFEPEAVVSQAQAQVPAALSAADIRRSLQNTCGWTAGASLRLYNWKLATRPGVCPQLALA